MKVFLTLEVKFTFPKSKTSPVQVWTGVNPIKKILNYIKKGFNKLNFILNDINFDAIYNKIVLCDWAQVSKLLNFATLFKRIFF